MLQTSYKLQCICVKCANLQYFFMLCICSYKYFQNIWGRCTVKKTKIHPLFIAYIILLVIMGQTSSVLVYFLCVAPHEIAHAYVAKRLGYKLQKFSLMPYGVCLNYNTNCFYNNDEILIAIAGPIANISLAILTTALWWIFPTTYALTHQFCFANLVIFMFNI